MPAQLSRKHCETQSDYLKGKSHLGTQQIAENQKQ